MLYKINYDIPANTVETAVDKQKLQVSKGKIKQWIIFMPKQCADLAKFKVFYHDLQILPFTRGTWCYGFQIPTIIPEDLKLGEPPYELDIHAVNTDDRFTHEYNLYVNIEPSKTVDPLKNNEGIIQKFKDFFGGE